MVNTFRWAPTAALAVTLAVPTLANAQDIFLATGGADLTWHGTATGAKAGIWMDIGAVSNDTRRDLIVGAPGTSGTSGTVYVIFGGPDCTGDRSLSLADTVITSSADREPLRCVHRRRKHQEYRRHHATQPCRRRPGRPVGPGCGVRLQRRLRFRRRRPQHGQRGLHDSWCAPPISSAPHSPRVTSMATDFAKSSSARPARAAFTSSRAGRPTCRPVARSI